MTAIVAFESAKLPAFLRGKVVEKSELSANVGGGGFPVMSIKGKVFTLVHGDERTTMMNPNDQDEVATSITVVLLKANAGLSKVWYPNGYVEGNTDAPACFSHDGVEPDPSAENKQHTKCQGCPKNAWGSKISEAGKKLKACSDSRRVAIANIDDLENPILLRVPAATLKPLAEYGDKLAERGAPYNSVFTKIGFDHESASPKLTFKPVGFAATDEESYKLIVDASESEAVKNILGTQGSPVVDDGADQESAAPAPKPTPAPAKPAVKAKPAPKEYEQGGAAEEEAPAPVAAKPKAAPKPAAVVSGDSLEDDLDALLNGLDD